MKTGKKFRVGDVRTRIQGNGEMPDMVRAFPWTSTALGPIESWSAALVTSVNTILSAPIPSGLFWGSELRVIYNDAYRDILGNKHPAALGEVVSTVWWDAWEAISPDVRMVLETGGNVIRNQVLIPVNRQGSMEDAYWIYRLSPVYEIDGFIAGVLVTCQEITQAVYSERLLRASEDRILQSIGDAVIVTDALGQISRMNPVAEALTGWSQREACGIPLAEAFRIVNEGTRLPVESPAAKVKRLGTIVGLANHTILIRRDGSETHIDDSGAPIFDEMGRLAGIVLVFRDITERWRQERKIEAYNANLKFLLRLSDQLRSLPDPRSIMRAASEALGRELQVGRVGYGEISEAGSEVLFESGWAQRPVQALAGSLPFQSFGSGNIADLRAGKTTVYDNISNDPRMADRTQTNIGTLSVIGVPILRNGKLRAVLYVHHGQERHWSAEEISLVEGVAERTSDAVERARTSQSLRLTEEELRYTVELSEQIQWTADPTGRILDFSQSWLHTTGLTREEALGDGWAQVPHPEDRAKMTAAWTHSLETGKTYDIEHRIRTASGEFCWRRSRALPRRDAAGQIVKWYGTTEDIDARKRAEQALIQSEKLAAVGRLASSIAHEINNPLESVMNLLYLAKGSSDPAEINDYLETADRELRRVSAITNQTLRFHRQTTKPTETTCEELFETVLGIYQGRLINSHVAVVKRKRARVPVVCFADEIRQVLNNLVGNSIDAMHPEGGRLFVRSNECIDWRTGERCLALTVADTGAGMSPHTKTKVFEPFYTTKGITGTGLGLWISSEIIHRHHGRLSIRSSQAEGRSGTIMRLLLPMNASDS